MTKRKKILSLTILIVALIVLFNWQMTVYLFQQAKGQWHVLSQAEPLSYFLEQKDFPDSLKIKIQVVMDAKRFAVDSIGLDESDSYTTMFDQKGKEILWNISASDPYALVAYEWCFPVMGCFSYKGYFDHNRALEEKARLDSLGYDTRVRPVGGWSTLGWFNDPILSNMLYSETGDLAETIVHELTHGTLYIKDSVNFNENLASFVGHKGTIWFLSSTYGEDSEAYNNYIKGYEDRKIYIDHMLRGAEKLDSLYATMAENNVEDKDVLKERFIREVCNKIDTLQFNNDAYYGFFAEELPNNAYFMSLRRYEENAGDLDRQFSKLNNDLTDLVRHLKGKYKSL